MKYEYIDEDGKTHVHNTSLSCIWCGDSNHRLYQRQRAEDSAPLNIDWYGVICEQCVIDERVYRFERRATRYTASESRDYERHAEDQQRIQDAKEGF